MAREGLLIGAVAKQSGASRKALRLYERVGILPLARRTEAGYRVYGADTLDVLTFVRQAQRLGFNLGEIKDIVSIKRAHRVPGPYVQELVRRKVDDLDQQLQDLTQVRKYLRAMLSGWRSKGTHHDGGTGGGEHEDVPLPDVRPLPRGRDHGRRSTDR